jgi:hypothetical protein
MAITGIGPVLKTQAQRMAARRDLKILSHPWLAVYLSGLQFVIGKRINSDLRLRRIMRR